MLLRRLAHLRRHVRDRGGRDGGVVLLRRRLHLHRAYVLGADAVFLRRLLRCPHGLGGGGERDDGVSAGPVLRGEVLHRERPSDQKKEEDEIQEVNERTNDGMMQGGREAGSACRRLLVLLALWVALALVGSAYS